MGFHLVNRWRTVQMRLKEDSDRLGNNSISDLKFLSKNTIEQCVFFWCENDWIRVHYYLCNIHYGEYLWHSNNDDCVGLIVTLNMNYNGIKFWIVLFFLFDFFLILDTKSAIAVLVALNWTYYLFMVFGCI